MQLSVLRVVENHISTRLSDIFSNVIPIEYNFQLIASSQTFSVFVYSDEFKSKVKDFISDLQHHQHR